MQIKFEKDRNKALAYDNDKEIAYCQYELRYKNLWEITHTVVDKNYGGKGLAGKLLDEVCQHARKEKVKIIPTCSYAAKKFDENKEKYQDLDARWFFRL